MKAHRSAAGGKKGGGAQRQAIGVSRGGRNTKVRALSDGAGRPLAFRPTGGNAADAPQAAALPANLPNGVMVLADKAYDADAIRPSDRRARRCPEHSVQVEPQMERPLPSLPLQGSERHRAHVLPPEGLPKDRRPYHKRADTFLPALQIAALIA